MDQSLVGLPPNLQAEQLALQRKQALTQALLQRSLQGIPTPTNPGRLASPISPFAPIAQAVSAALAGRAGKEQEGQQVELAGKYQNQMSQAIKDYMAQRDGQPGEPGSPATGLIEGAASPSASTPAIPATPGNPRAAAVSALTSGFSTLQHLGQMDMQTMAKNTLTNKDILSLEGYSPESKIAGARLLQNGMPIDMVLQTLGPKKDIRVGPGGEVADVSGPTPKQTGYIGPEWEKNPDGTPKVTMIKGADGQVEPYQRNERSGELKKLDNAPKVSTTVNNAGNAGPKAGAIEIFKRGADTVNELGKTARSANSSIEGIQRLKALDQQGVFSNATTGPQTFLSNLAQGLGVKLSPEEVAKLGRTENYNSIATKLWQDQVAQLGGNRNVTAVEAEQIKNIIPLTKHSPQARADMYDILSNVAQREISRFKAANTAFSKAVASDKPEIWQQHFENVFLPPAEGPKVAPQPRAVDAVSNAIVKPAKKTDDGWSIEEVAIPGSQ